MTQTDFNRTITPEVKAYADHVSIKFATFNSKDYVNFSVAHLNGYQMHTLATTMTRKGIEQLRDALLRIAPVNDTAQTQGQFIVSLVEGAEGYLPSSKPFVHYSREDAVVEAKRLAKLYGGTFVVLRAVHEASRPVPVIPPVTDRSL